MQAFERRLWPHQHPLRQFEGELKPELLMKIEDRNLDLDRWSLKESDIPCLLPSKQVHSVSPVMPDLYASQFCGFRQSLQGILL